MPTTVSLNISTTNDSGYKVATDIKPKNKRLYYYKYSGGDASTNNGNVSTPTGTPITFTVSLVSVNSTYTINKVKFTDGNNDASYVLSADKKSAAITDKAKHKGEITYYLNIDDSNESYNFDCDPRIIHT